MDNVIKNLAIKVAEYIEKTQPVIDEQNERRINFIKRAEQAANVLVRCGIIEPRRVNEFVDKIASDPELVWEFVEKLASIVKVDDMGIPAATKEASENNVCPFERIFFGVGRGNFSSFD